MAHFYVTTTNSRGKTVSACATKKAGQVTHARGWDCGVRIESTHFEHTGKSLDSFAIFATGGSNGKTEKYIGQIVLDQNGEPTFQRSIKKS